ncbi:MAG: quinone-dependent dihydroorotate dehydrogenase [Deltaproteobacteria bacterium]|nr:quinone-dependent dihydroorotate dehydrogenase [Deltaproteobacteria bacterium]
MRLLPWPLLKALLFRLDPERAHAVALAILQRLGRSGVGRPLLRLGFDAPIDDPVTVMGLRFRNRVGLAAGWDKDARAWPGLACMGFGHVEVGTITPRPQPGNPKPRIFRLPEDRAVINRMGFPGEGMAAALPRLLGPGRADVVLGVNLGRNKDTPNERAAEDYVGVLRALGPRCDYAAINVSSPNTPGLRALQRKDELRALVQAVTAARDALDRPLPVAVKIAPDLDEAGIDAAVEAALEAGADGIIASNTTLAREGLRSPHAGQTGGLSGQPLEALARRVLQRVVQRADGKLAVIAVGGVTSADDARIRRELGADLVQLYTGLVYRGPALVHEVAAALRGLH